MNTIFTVSVQEVDLMQLCFYTMFLYCADIFCVLLLLHHTAWGTSLQHGQSYANINDGLDNTKYILLFQGNEVKLES